MNSKQLQRLGFNLLKKIYLKSNYTLTSNIHYQLVNNLNFNLNQNNQQQFLNKINLINNSIQLQKRFKSKKGKNKKSSADDDTDSDSDDSDEDKSDDESSSDDEEGEGKLTKLETINTRLDMLLKNAIGGPKHRIETAITEDKVRVNGERVLKKSYNVEIGDVVDFIRGYVDNDPERLNITRCEFVDIDGKLNSRGKILSKIRITKNLEIENYKNARYEYF